MLPLDSPKWADLTHAYGEASHIPGLLKKLESADAANWESLSNQLMCDLGHQGDVYTATYAAAPHILNLAVAYGPCWQCNELLEYIARISGNNPGPPVPDDLKLDWLDAQDETRDLILDRLLNQQVSENDTIWLIGALLSLSGEFSAASIVCRWPEIKIGCSACGYSDQIFWHKDALHHAIEKTSRLTGRLIRKSVRSPVTPTRATGIVLDSDMEFEEEILADQILGLAAACGHAAVLRQMQFLLGSIQCGGCEQTIPLTPLSFAIGD